MSNDVDALGVEKPREKWNSVTRAISVWCSMMPGRTGTGPREMTYSAAARLRQLLSLLSIESRRKLTVFIINQWHR